MNRSIILSLFLGATAGAEVETVTDPFGKMPAGKTVVWSPLFQATWDAMNKAMGGKPKKIDPPNELMSRLDSFEWKADEVMPDGRWKTWAGQATPEFVGEVNREAAKLTGEEKGPFNLEGLSPAALACFGLLDREVEFVNEFRESKKHPLKFKLPKGEEDVAFFGTRGSLSAYYRGVVKVLYHSEKWHALEVKCKGVDDRVVLYLPNEPESFNEACEMVRKLMKSPEEVPDLDPTLNEGDDVRIPYVSLDATADFLDEMEGGRFYGGPGDPWKIVKAQQKTRFELFEKGAKVRVQADLGLQPFGEPPPPPKPRNFHFDRPFFVFLWRDKAEWPYFGAWIGDASALRKF